MDSVILTCGRCYFQARRPRIEGMIVDPIGWTTITVSGTPMRTMRLCSTCSADLGALLADMGFAAKVEDAAPARLEVTDQMVEAFGAAWEAEDARSSLVPGARRRAGIAAVLAILDGVNNAG